MTKMPLSKDQKYSSKENHYRAKFAWNLYLDIKSAINSLRGRFVTRDKADRLFKKFITLEDSDKFFIVNSLSKVDNDVSRAFLETVLISDFNDVVRHEAAFSLGWVGDEISKNVLKSAIIDDESVLVRHEAVMALSEIGSEEDIDFVEEILTSEENKEVILSCHITLKRLDDRIKKLLPPIS